MISEEEMELKIREFFEDNFSYLKENSGHSIDAYMKEKAFQQVLYYWKKNRKLIERIARSEVRLSLPEQRTPGNGMPYTLEGVVDIVQEGDEVWLYDLKTHDVDRIAANRQLYMEQLYIYAYIFKNLQGNTLDNTAVISTVLPERLVKAISLGKTELIEQELQRWQPVIPLGYSEDEVADMIENFGEVVEKIESSNFKAPDAGALAGKASGTDKTFAVQVCRNCDVRYSCKSYAEYLTTMKGAGKSQLFEYMVSKLDDHEDFLNNNLSEE